MKHNFPITIIDDFFTNPNEVIRWSKSLNYTKDSLLRYPGIRSKNLSEIDTGFIYELSRKILSIFYENIPTNYHVEAFFDIIKNKTYEEGWVHRDNADVSFIVYLNKEYLKNCGTSLYVLKNKHIGVPNRSLELEIKNKDYHQEIISNEGRKARIGFNSQYDKVLDNSPKFNRLLIFPSSHAHSANLLDTGTEEDRLILVGYISEIYSNTNPLKRFNSIFPDN